MSSHLVRKRGASTRAFQLAGLLACFLLVWAAVRLSSPAGSDAADVAALGLFLMGGTLASELLETLRVPHLTAYLAVGVIAGPHVLALVRHATVESLLPVNGLALSLIALAGGAELRLDAIKSAARPLAWATLTQCFGALVATALVFLAVSPLVPFARGGGPAFLLGIALLEGVLAITRSPAAVLAVLSQTHAKGPIARFSLAFVMLSDVVVLVLAALVITLTRPLVDAGASFSTTALVHLGREIVGSVSLGTTLGLVIAFYLKVVRRNFVVVLVALGFGFTDVIRYLQFEPLLTFLVAGFLVQNLSKQGEKLLASIEDMESVVYVLFFAIAGADLDLMQLRALWPAALLLFGGRVAVTFGSHGIAMRLAGDQTPLRRWGFAGLVSQAGIAVGIAASIQRAYPSFGAAFNALAIATIALNEVFGPVLFKYALDATGESSPGRERERPAS